MEKAFKKNRERTDGGLGAVKGGDQMGAGGQLRSSSALAEMDTTAAMSILLLLFSQIRLNLKLLLFQIVSWTFSSDFSGAAHKDSELPHKFQFLGALVCP